MKTNLLLIVLVCASGAFAAQAAARQTFTGVISDSACGSHHMMEQVTPKECTLECIKMGAKFVLVVPAAKKIYALSDQSAARPYAGEKVTVIGSLKDSTIEVASIKPVTPANKPMAPAKKKS